MEDVMKLAIVFTGGTIGSVITGDTINVDLSARDVLLDYVDKHIEEEMTFEITQPLNILSENMTPKHWGIIQEHILSLLEKNFDGIIMAHGSDTIPYTAAMMSYLFNYIDIPLVITASNYPLEDIRSNGRQNVLNSIRFIEEDIPGIFTLFENDQDEGVVYLGTRMLEAMHVTDEFQSFGDIYFGKMIEGQFVYHNVDVNPPKAVLKEKRERVFSQVIDFHAPIMVIKPYPGLNYDYYQFTEHKPKAIIHDLYHSSTHNTLDELPNASLVNFIHYCKSEGIDLYLVPFRKEEEKMYMSSKKLMDAGAIPLKNISLIGAITKLTLAYSVYEEQTQRDAFIEKDIFCEYLKKTWS